MKFNVELYKALIKVAIEKYEIDINTELATPWLIMRSEHDNCEYNRIFDTVKACCQTETTADVVSYLLNRIQRAIEDQDDWSTYRYYKNYTNHVSCLIAKE
jgi:hypothetical protein